MPYNRRKGFRRKPRKNKYNPRPFQLLKRKPSSQAPRILNFKRQSVQTMILNASSAPTGWTSLTAGGDPSLVTNFNIALSSIPNYTNFTNLFDSYRIKGVRLVGYLSYNVTDSTTQAQSILYYCRDHLGQNAPATLSEDWFLERPRSRKRMLVNSVGKPSFDIFMPVSNLTVVYQTALLSDYAMTKPKFISTNEVDTPYYGFNLRIQRVDGQNWTSDTSNVYPTLKIYSTVYFQMRGINS